PLHERDPRVRRIDVESARDPDLGRVLARSAGFGRPQGRWPFGGAPLGHGNHCIVGRMKKRKLGRQGLVVSELGLGCMGMSEFYGPRDDAESSATLERALELGLDFFDTADVYGAGHNEELG